MKLLAVFALAGLLVPQADTKPVRVLITTSQGEIEVEVDTARAPLTAANFLKYVDAGHYTNGQFHRTVKTLPDNQPMNTVKIDVIQGSADLAKANAAFPPIQLERTSKTGLKHTDGALSMARDGADTATHEFFICVGDQPELDFGGKRNPDGQGFAAFGLVVRGMDVVRKIHASPAKAQKLTPPVRIQGAQRL